ncbi:MAG: phenylalanyl-tRNA synthetase subunit beta, phenylalanyl-tRNA synthetase beta chain, partial [Parcubacteria group bacterium]|nr:phenylalanyl-tRNA synthetase subunit beta, phenylalanyl-tRNA synthetase beta chain [Parcubacteria group bacterium]
QNFFEQKLPEAEKLAGLLTMHSFEIESFEENGNDYVFEAKILPNMAHHCLSHRGVASEISAILGIPMKTASVSLKGAQIGKTSSELEIDVLNSNICRRYVGRIIENLEVKQSPRWLKERLESIGQKSINNIVDAANFVMFEIGQPMHAFDLDKLDSVNGEIKITVKNASGGDSITTLDGKDVVLDENTLTISNGNNPLAIAGIKGGNFAEIGNATKNIIIESANFAPALIRKESRRLNILTDSSKRFENEISPEKALEAMEMMTSLVAEIACGENTIIGDISDFYPKKINQNKIEISLKEINNLLGTNIDKAETEKILKRLNFYFEAENSGENFTVAIPFDRLDIKIKEDLIEEVGRIYGYEKIKEQKISSVAKLIPINKSFYYKNKIRNLLVQNGFSEVYTYAFADKGEMEMENPIASDKKFLRANLKDGINKSLDFNLHYADLLGFEQIKIFEIGKIFKNGKETDYLAIGIRNSSSFKGNKEEDEIKIISDALSKDLGVVVTWEFSKNGIAEIDFEKMVERLPIPESCEDIKIEKYDIERLKYRKISPYPFVLRDIAVFVPQGVEEKDVASIIEKEAGELLVNKRLFDVFVKKFPDGISKTSFAFRLVFQSQQKTLSDEEVNKIMEKVSKLMNINDGWQVR